MICDVCKHDCHCGEKCEIDSCLCPNCQHTQEKPMIKQIKKWWRKYVDWLFTWK